MNIDKQIQRLEDLVSCVYNGCVNSLGDTHPVSKQGLKSIAYLEGLKYDIVQLQKEIKWR